MHVLPYSRLAQRQWLVRCPILIDNIDPSSVSLRAYTSHLDKQHIHAVTTLPYILLRQHRVFLETVLPSES